MRRGRLDWPDGATSRDSLKAVLKLPRLQVCQRVDLLKCYVSSFVCFLQCSCVCVLQNLIMQHVDHSAGELINMVQGLLRFDPSERLTAREALRHPFFTRSHLRR